ncbi:MarR family transcriptional regulator, partial [Streptomyces sioyaensis]|uniref:MarR family winged helix-turn-helix transcriptional regulator n=1 Tax=Streptomyces sioyaensis TaxID=67364 RepID=UPI0034752EB7
VDRLIAAGFADRQINPDNRRETRLGLTEQGRHIVGEVTARRRREIATVVERMPPGQRASLIEALTAFAEAGGEPAAPEAGPDLHPLGWPDPPRPTAS